MLWIIFGFILITMIVIYILAGKKIVIQLSIPFTIVFAGWFLMLYERLVMFSHIARNFMNILYGFSVLIFFTWILLHLFKNKSNPGQFLRKIIVWILCIVLSVVIYMVPKPTHENLFYIYQKSYINAAEEIFHTYDENGLGYEYDLSITKDKEEIESIFLKDVVKKIEKLYDKTRVLKIAGNKEGVYFFYEIKDALATGIVVMRNSNGEIPDITFIKKYMRKPIFKELKENVYLFQGEI